MQQDKNKPPIKNQNIFCKEFFQSLDRVGASTGALARSTKYVADARGMVSFFEASAKRATIIVVIACCCLQ